MHWLFQNINHLTAPLGMLLGPFSAIFGLIARRRRKQGREPINVPRGVIAGLYVGLLLCAVLLGVALARNFG